MLLMFASLAAVVYPFKPFKKRLHALFTAFCFFIAIGVFGSMMAPPTGQTQRTETSVAATVDAAETNDVPEPVKVATDTANEETPDAEIEGPSSPSSSELASIREAFDRGDWGQAGLQLRLLRSLNRDIDEISSELEDKVLAVVRPLPVSDHQGNLYGYELLSVIRPDNNTYTQKVSEYEGRIEAAKRTAVAALERSEDKIDGVVWYKHPNQPRYLNSRSTAYLYIGQRINDTRPWLRMKVQYTSRDWLFVDNVIAFHDGVSEPMRLGRFERDNNSTIWEWVDETPTDYQIDVLRSLGNAREAVLRFEGSQYRKDVTLSAGDKRAIRDVLLAYDVLRSSN